MTPDRVAPETPAPMISLGEAKKILGVPVDNLTYDEQIQFAIDVVSQIVRSQTGRYLMLDTYKDEFTAPQFIQREAVFLSLWEFPVKMIKSVEVDGIPQMPTSYRLRKDYGIFLPSGYGVPQNLLVEYQAGYAKLPADLLSVFYDLMRRQLSAIGVDLSTVSNTVPDAAPVKAVSIGQLRVEYAVASAASNMSLSNMSPMSESVLSEYEAVFAIYRHPNQMAATGT